MANICNTDYIIVGAEKDIKDLEEMLIDVERGETYDKEDIQPYDLWIGLYAKAFGFDTETNDCRGSMNYHEILNGELHMSVQSDWNRLPIIEEMISSRFPDLDIYYRVEELGCEVFYTNDSSRCYFKSKYYFEADCEGEYALDDEELIKLYSKAVNRKFDTIEEVWGHYGENYSNGNQNGDDDSMPYELFIYEFETR